MTINPFSTSSIRDHVLEKAQDNFQGARDDVQVRNQHMQAMVQDLKAGDMEGAKEEKAAALDAQTKVSADQKTLLDFHQDASQLRSDFKQRSQDMKDFASAIQSGDMAAAKKAFQDLSQIQHTIRNDVHEVRTDASPVPNPAPTPAPSPVATPVDVTA